MLGVSTNLDSKELLLEPNEMSDDSVELHDEAGLFLQEYSDFYVGQGKRIVITHLVLLFSMIWVFFGFIGLPVKEQLDPKQDLFDLRLLVDGLQDNLSRDFIFEVR